ncbi:MAG: peptide chain release factor N(5)-glutamine methyltransferase, partial [Verrucomicrobia bacterium]|nr:peptide chain release factor N(5)-glutamine methyltransferase [Verrucomicrobiota bacterium]
MPSVLEILKLSSEFLAKREVESPRLQAELMLAHILQMPRLKLYLNFETALATSQVDQMRALVRRRGQREPLQHLLGTTSFCGLEIKTT